ncbi:MAG TPA: carbonic anhydrase [Deltaproteobacteria bacterium]|nr:carbonic anhydrase [Deltaproteobacteria bacterium]
MKHRLINVSREGEIPERYRHSPVGELLRCHNMGGEPAPCAAPRLVTVMCMDSRKTLRVPRNFSFVVRNSGGTVTGVSFAISYALAVGGIDHLAVIGHSDCRMVDLAAQREAFVAGLVGRWGWDAEAARRHFDEMAPRFGKVDAVESVLRDVRLIRSIYPGLTAAPLFYLVEDDRLYLVDESDGELREDGGAGTPD